MKRAGKVKNMKSYTQFKDIYGNQYGFESYIDFATFWFAIPFSYAKKVFPEFSSLQKCAAYSKEARTKLSAQ